jgi:serine/threonine protein kinase
MAHQLALIEEERRSWEGTQRVEVTIDELDDRYVVREIIGSGSFGTVYRAVRRADMQEFAVKEVDMSDSPRQRAGAIAECVLWQSISRVYHPSILHLIEILEMPSEQSVFLVTELIAHGVLSEAVFDLEMSEQSCRQIMIQLTSAVAHLHGVHQVAHCDLKPSNVLCKYADPTAPGSLKLCDFGCSLRFKSLKEPEFTLPTVREALGRSQTSGAHLPRHPAASLPWHAATPTHLANSRIRRARRTTLHPSWRARGWHGTCRMSSVYSLQRLPLIAGRWASSRTSFSMACRPSTIQRVQRRRRTTSC